VRNIAILFATCALASAIQAAQAPPAVSPQDEFTILKVQWTLSSSVLGLCAQNVPALRGEVTAALASYAGAVRQAEAAIQRDVEARGAEGTRYIERFLAEQGALGQALPRFTATEPVCRALLERTGVATASSLLNIWQGFVDKQIPAGVSPAVRLPPRTPAFGVPEHYRVYTLNKAPVDGLKLGELTIRFGETAISEVATTIGASLVRSNERGSWLCYFWNEASADFQLWLETGTLSATVGKVTIKAETPHPESRCAELPGKFRDVVLLNGLRLKLAADHAPRAIAAAIPALAHVGQSEQLAFIYRSVVPACGGYGAQSEGSLFIEWRYPRMQFIHQLVAVKDTDGC
jgi:hypothetical protein